MLMKRRSSEASGVRPVINLRQEKTGCFPLDRVSSASAIAVNAGSESLELCSCPGAILRLTETVCEEHLAMSDRRKRSEEGCAPMRSLASRAHFVERTKKNAVPREEFARHRGGKRSGSRLRGARGRLRACRLLPRQPRALVASTTAMIWSTRQGKARSSARSC